MGTVQAMTSQQRKQYFDDGYLIVRGLICGNDLADLDRMVDRLLDGALKPETAYKAWRPAAFDTFWEPDTQDRTDLPRRERVRLMSNMCHHHPYFGKFGSHRAIYKVVSSLYGGGVRMFSDTVFMKPTHHGIEAALHQDTAFWPKLEPNAMNFWLAIDPATVRNGCLHIIPGSHKVDLLHQDDPIQGNILHDHQIDISKQIPMEFDSGDAIFFDSGLVHRSYPNHSDLCRRAYSAVYGAENLKHVAPWKTSSIAGETPDYQFELIEPPIGSQLDVKFKVVSFYSESKEKA